jgi:hypothetical protein
MASDDHMYPKVRHECFMLGVPLVYLVAPRSVKSIHDEFYVKNKIKKKQTSGLCYCSLAFDYYV